MTTKTKTCENKGHEPFGMKWSHNLPSHWGIRRLRSVVEMRVSNVDKHTNDDEISVRLCNYVDVYYNDRIDGNLPYMKATASPAEADRFQLKPNDVIITKDSEAWNDIAVPALVVDAPNDLVCGYHLAILRPSAAIDGSYLARVLQTPQIAHQFHVEAQGITRYGLTHNSILSAGVPLPPLDEQAAIVRSLDHADELINRYISAKERLIALLEEQRQAVIHQTVTQGVDPHVPMRPAEMDWIGDVPQHWKKRRLKEIAAIQTGITIGPDNGHPGLFERPYLRVANVQADHLDLSQVTKIRVSPAEIKRSTLQVGDVLMTEGGDIDKLGRGCIWQGEIPGCLHQNHVFAVRPDPALLNPEFLVAVMGSVHGRTYFYLTAKQTTNLAATNRTTLGNLPIYLPSASEQLNILNHIENKRDAVDNAINQARQQINLMNEYRTRLIADAVTGQIDLRNATASVPEP